MIDGSFVQGLGGALGSLGAGVGSLGEALGGPSMVNTTRLRLAMQQGQAAQHRRAMWQQMSGPFLSAGYAQRLEFENAELRRLLVKKRELDTRPIIVHSLRPAVARPPTLWQRFVAWLFKPVSFCPCAICRKARAR